MANLLIRDVPDDVIAAIDAHARRLGLSRSEYLRRTLAREHRGTGGVTVTDLQNLADEFAGLADPEMMDDAWS